jgi:uncharacterized damage-inducible protein DinB
MTLKNYFLHQLADEATVTRKMLALVPEDKYQWQPHPKSMTLIRLATHVAELPSWIPMTFRTDELDFAKEGYNEQPMADNAQLLEYFEKNLTDGLADLEAFDESEYEKPWTMRSGETIFFTELKCDVIRTALSQLIHHRAQLGVFLRLLNIPIPGSYGPSADEMGLFEEAPVAGAQV